MQFCSLYSGSSGNCIYIGSQKAKILVDAGLSGKRVVNSLKEIGISPKDIDALVVTHEHIDHVKGVGILSRMFNIPIYANNKTWDSMQDLIGPVREENKKVIEVDEFFTLGDVEVKSFRTPHDAAQSVGYCFFNGCRKISIATDIGHVSHEVLQNIKGSDLVLLESNHDVEMLKFGPYPYVLKRRILGDTGHLSNDDAGKAILNLLGDKFVNVILGHLSHKNNYPELAYRTVLSILQENDINIDKDVKVYLANRDRVGAFFEIS